MGESRFDPFDFATWAELARTDPDAFEAKRLEAIEQLFDSLPEDRRGVLRRFQWWIDKERERAKTPLGACVRFSEMLSDQVHGEGGLKERLDALSAAAKGEAPEVGGEDGLESSPDSIARSGPKVFGKIVEFPTPEWRRPVEGPDQDPADPVDPAGRADPVDPAHSVDPVDPVGRADPVDPAHSVDPADPAGRADPVNPAHSVDPEIPRS